MQKKIGTNDKRAHLLCAGQVCIHVALAAEAQPIIEVLGLVAQQVPASMQCLQRYYVHPTRPLHLIVSGVGQVAAALAIQAWLLQTPLAAAATIISIGVAGHATAPIGSLWRVDQVTAQYVKAAFYPGAAFKSDLKQSALCSMHAYHDTYTDDTLLDMESYAVLQAATLFVAREQVEILKIVSDNRRHTLSAQHRFKAATLFDLMQPQVDAMMYFIDKLELLAAELALREQQFFVDISAFTEKWHFTHYQRHQLQHRLRSLIALQGQDACTQLMTSDAARAADVLRKAQELLGLSAPRSKCEAL